jgi:hypothetical protein
VLHKIPADGDCFFNAMKYLGITDLSIAKLRQQVAGILRANSEKYEEFLDGVTVKDAANHIEQTGRWDIQIIDLVPEILATQLKVTLNIINLDATLTEVNVKPEQPVYWLVLVQQEQIKHYHILKTTT